MARLGLLVREPSSKVAKATAVAPEACPRLRNCCMKSPLLTLVSVVPLIDKKRRVAFPLNSG
jgi:hypothetical protein